VAAPEETRFWVLALGLGGVLMVAGSVMSWVTVRAPLVGQFEKAGTEGDGLITLGIGGVVVLIAGAARNGRGLVLLAVAAAILAAAGAAVVVYDFVDIDRVASNIELPVLPIESESEFVDKIAGPGLYVTGIGCALSVLAALVLMARRVGASAPTADEG